MKCKVAGIIVAGVVLATSSAALAEIPIQLGPPNNPPPTDATHKACDAFYQAYKYNPANLPGDGSGPQPQPAQDAALGSPVVNHLFKQTLGYCADDGWTP
jgi:hypothetical protein